jgi:DNA repair exonuclease SbcCD ATPase subunit
MEIQTVQLHNFGSYQELKFAFAKKGLALIHGPTGSGKSTFCDAVPWILFGKTAKNGSVDEIVSWNAEGPTTGTATVKCKHKTLCITRVRTPKGNDLYYSVLPHPEAVRGKDLADTQRLINQHLGIDSELYLSAAYFHEFSQTASFFTTNAKNRRLLCEQLVDLSLPKRLRILIDEDKKVITQELNVICNELDINSKLCQQLRRQQKSINEQWHQWEEDKKEKIADLEYARDHFEEQQTEVYNKLAVSEANYAVNIAKKIEKLEYRLKHSTVCSECNSKVPLTELQVKGIQDEIVAYRQSPNLYTEQIKRERQRQSTDNQQLHALIKEKNPHTLNNTAEIAKLTKIMDLNEIAKDENQLRLADLELLSDAIDCLRAVSVKNTINELQNRINGLLSKYFDAEIQVTFEVEAADKVDVVIQKDGNHCSYAQLSKGQRKLLNLCFGLSVMKTVSEHHGLSLSSVFIDEALDGFSEQLKIKSYRLLQSLETDYDNIFVVEHSQELKALFTTQYRVELADKGSALYEEA